jgi:hypothetical protein
LATTVVLDDFDDDDEDDEEEEDGDKKLVIMLRPLLKVFSIPPLPALCDVGLLFALVGN